MKAKTGNGLNRAISSVVIAIALIMGITATGYAATGQISKIIAGYDNTFIITEKGELFAAGKNVNGQLGDGTDQNILRFASVFDGVSDVSPGGEHTLFLMNDGALWAVGHNNLGQLGDGTNDDKWTPVKIMDNCAFFSAGYSHSMAIDSAGALYGWGYNGNRILADGTNVSKNTPHKIADGIKLVNAGTYYNLAVKADNSLYVLPDVGANISASQVAAVAGGKEHALILSENNELFAYGYNAFGQLGNGTFSDSDVLVKIMSDVVQIAAGSDYSMALKTDNTLWAWGNNEFGQLGNKDNVNQNAPVKIMDNVVQISASSTHSAALTADGAIYLWGSNGVGQFGSTATLRSNTPVLIDISADISSDWAYPEILGAKKAGIAPRALLSKYRQATTRAEFCALAVAVYETVVGSVIDGRSTFADTEDVNVQKAASIGVVMGIGDNKFNPNASLTREQAATMLARLADALQKPLDKQASGFADNDSISYWAAEGVGQVSAAGIMGGIGNNIFAPADSYTREQSIATALRMYNLVK